MATICKRPSENAAQVAVEIMNDSVHEDTVSGVNAKATVWILAAYAIAMALLEAAVVVYMRRLYYPERPLDLFPMEFLRQYDPALELAREAATIVMIVTVALLAERRSLHRKFAAFVFVFGLWDIFYYVWLKILIGWPRTWLEWDVLFLIPSVWLGPWICPAAIALMFVIWGTWALIDRNEVTFTRVGLVLFVAGAMLGLVSFMQPAAELSLRGDTEALSRYTPGHFWWWLFVPSYLMMAAGFLSGWSSRSSR